MTVCKALGSLSSEPGRQAVETIVSLFKPAEKVLGHAETERQTALESQAKADDALISKLVRQILDKNIAKDFDLNKNRMKTNAPLGAISPAIQTCSKRF